VVVRRHGVAHEEVTMTTGTTIHHNDGPAVHLRPTPDERRLRRVLRFNAGVSALTVLACTVLAAPIADLLVVPVWTVVLVAGVAAAWTGFVGWSSATNLAALRRFAPVAALGDASWVVGTAVLFALGAVDPRSWWLLVPAAVVVGDLAAAQFVLWRRIR